MMLTKKEIKLLMPFTLTLLSSLNYEQPDKSLLLKSSPLENVRTKKSGSLKGHHHPNAIRVSTVCNCTLKTFVRKRGVILGNPPYVGQEGCQKNGNKVRKSQNFLASTTIHRLCLLIDRNRVV
jgi:hypothetical protein